MRPEALLTCTKPHEVKPGSKSKFPRVMNIQHWHPEERTLCPIRPCVSKASRSPRIAREAARSARQSLAKLTLFRKGRTAPGLEDTSNPDCMLDSIPESIPKASTQARIVQTCTSSTKAAAPGQQLSGPLPCLPCRSNLKLGTQSCLQPGSSYSISFRVFGVPARRIPLPTKA